jgi:hypothetical protein
MSRRQRNTSRRQRNARIDELADEFDIEILRMEPADVYDPAVIGFAHDPSDAVTRLVYDCDRVIAQAVAFEGMSYEDAVEWHEFNTFCAYMGPTTPLFLRRLSVEDVADEVRGEPRQPTQQLAPLVAVESDDTVVGVPV